MKVHVMDRRFCLALIAAFCSVAALPAFSASETKPQDPKTSAKQAGQKYVASETQDAGEEKFKQNCSRCHEAPQELSTRTSGTVLRHMRVRASLSESDERDILKFLNP